MTLNRKALILFSIGMACTPALSETFQAGLVSAALERTQHRVRYDGSYHAIDYPGGDVPAHIGVCTDVIIRSYRALGTDLQKLVHEDISSHFADYPSQRIWGLKHPDRNIDHRRVPILQTFFSRKGETLPVTDNHEDYQPGDLVTWQGRSAGLAGQVVASQPYRVGSQDCRQYTHTVTAGTAAPSVVRGTACRNPDGSWTLLS